MNTLEFLNTPSQRKAMAVAVPTALEEISVS